MVCGIKHIKFNGWEDILLKKIMKHKGKTSYFQCLRSAIQFLLVVVAILTPYSIMFAVVWTLKLTDSNIDLPEAYLLIALISVLNFPIRLFSSGLTMVRNSLANLEVSDRMMNFY